MNTTQTEVAKREAAPLREAEREALTYRPRVDLRETPEAFLLEAEMPGAGEADVDVKVENGILRVLGRVPASEPEAYKTRMLEFQPGNYERSFELADTIDAEHIEATMRHGVLRLKLPKREAAKPKRILVKVG